MLKEIKKKYIRSGIIGFVVFLILGAVLLLIVSDGVMALLKPVGDLNKMDADEIGPMRAKYTVIYVMDYFGYYEEDNVTVEKEYIVPVGEHEYMAIDLSGTQMYRANDNMEATWRIFDGDESAYDDIKPFEVSGSIVPLEGETLSFYKELIDNLDLSSEDKEIFLPYILKPDHIGKTESISFYVLIGLSLVLIIIGIIILAIGCSSKSLKQITTFCKNTGNEEAALARVEQFYQMTPNVNGVRLSPEFFMWLGGGKATFMPSENILWVYQHVVKHSYNFIPTGKTYSLMVKLADGKTVEMGMKNKKKAEETLDYFVRTLPYIYIGYDPQWMTLFSSNRQAMIQAVSGRRMQMSGQPPMGQQGMGYPGM
ncbi:MAG: hypothetical protein J1E61_11155 [Lachnospiraceae bacterium]|nr:hypothetical protein [Lachnospiraceae bacterium]